MVDEIRRRGVSTTLIAVRRAQEALRQNARHEQAEVLEALLPQDASDAEAEVLYISMPAWVRVRPDFSEIVSALETAREEA